MLDNLLSFITDEQLENFTKQVVEKVSHAADSAESGLYSNVVDPFSALFDSARQGLTLDEWLEQEKARQVQKTLQNALGKFHQQVLGSVPGGMMQGSEEVMTLAIQKRRLLLRLKRNTTR
jgi:hypothetical protein